VGDDGKGAAAADFSGKSRQGGAFGAGSLKYNEYGYVLDWLCLVRNSEHINDRHGFCGHMWKMIIVSFVWGSIHAKEIKIF
jgi:hypothetical protein